MTDLFFTVLKMSGYGVVTALVMVAALAILWRTRASKTALLLLWLVMGFRLVCPWSPSSPVSIFSWGVAERGTWNVSWEKDAYVGDPQAAVEAPDGEGWAFDRAVAAGVKPVRNPDTGLQEVHYYQNSAGNITPAKTFREAYGPVLSGIWLAGAAGFLGYGVISYILLKRRLRFAIHDEARGNVWLCDYIPSPCVAGLFRPQIYLTFDMTDEEKEYVLAHERQHIRNGDHIWKVLGWLILCVHWFNPPMWLLYRYFLWTVEEACDQRVLRALGEDKKEDYGQALLSLSSEKRFRPGFSPLAFGEGDTKGRVKTVLKYKKPLVWLTVIALAVGGVLSACVLTSRTEAEDQPAAEGIEEAYGIYYVSDVVHLTVTSSSTKDFELSRYEGAEIVVAQDRFYLGSTPVRYSIDRFQADGPIYEPLELGDRLLTTEIGGDDAEAASLFSVDLTKYKNVQG